MTYKPTWNKKKVKVLKELWDQGKTGKEIAKELGVSRSSVLGAVRRNNLPTRPRALLTPEERVRNKNKASRAYKARKRSKTVLPPTPVKDVFGPVPTTAVSFMDLRYRHCRMIVSQIHGVDTLYCGKPKKVSSWCEDCARVVFNKDYVPSQRAIRSPWLRRR